MSVSFTDVVAAAGDAVITTDSTGHIASWNPEAQVLLGFSPEQAIGQTLALIVPEPYRARHVAGFHRAVQEQRLTHQGRPAHVQAATASGELLPMIMTLGLLPGEFGESGGVVAVLRPADVTAVRFA